MSIVDIPHAPNKLDSTFRTNGETVRKYVHTCTNVSGRPRELSALSPYQLQHSTLQPNSLSAMLLYGSHAGDRPTHEVTPDHIFCLV